MSNRRRTFVDFGLTFGALAIIVLKSILTFFFLKLWGILWDWFWNKNKLMPCEPNADQTGSEMEPRSRRTNNGDPAKHGRVSE